MREPTRLSESLVWWREQLDGAEHPITESTIHCGYFKCRAYSHAARARNPGLKWPAPFLPGRIWLEQDIDFATGELTDDERFKAEIGDRIWEPQKAWTWLAQRPVTVREWTWLKARMPLLHLPRGTLTKTYT